MHPSHLRIITSIDSSFRLRAASGKCWISFRCGHRLWFHFQELQKRLGYFHFAIMTYYTITSSDSTFRRHAASGKCWMSFRCGHRLWFRIQELKINIWDTLPLLLWHIILSRAAIPLSDRVLQVASTECTAGSVTTPDFVFKNLKIYKWDTLTLLVRHIISSRAAIPLSGCVLQVASAVCNAGAVTTPDFIFKHLK